MSFLDIFCFQVEIYSDCVFTKYNWRENLSKDIYAPFDTTFSH